MKSGNIFRTALRHIGTYLDMLIFIVLILLAVSVLIGRNAHHPAIMILLTAALLLVGVLINRRKEQKRKAEERLSIERDILTEKLFLLSDESLSNMLKEPNMIFIRRFRPDEGEVLSAIAKQPNLLICAVKDSKTEDLIRRQSPKTQLYDLIEAAAKAGILCTPMEIETRRNETQNTRKKALKSRLWTISGWNRYLMLGMLLLVLSFVTSHKIYYRLLSSACMIFMTIRLISDTQKKRNIFRFFLDNRDMR